MNCNEVRASLPGFLYHDLQPDEVAAVDQHLTACPTCRHERAALERVREALGVVLAPAVQVDVTRLLQQAADRQTRRARRWRRTAVALAGLAAALLAAVALRLEVGMEANRLVLSWGDAPQTPTQSAVAPTEAGARSAARLPPDLAERLRVISDTVHALAADVEARDARQQQNLDVLRQQVDILRRQVSFQWSESQRRVALLRTVQATPNEKGDDSR
jgi:predicted anti-sigma-YlaC factor YlaD